LRPILTQGIQQGRPALALEMPMARALAHFSAVGTSPNSTINFPEISAISASKPALFPPLDSRKIFQRDHGK